MRLSVFQRWSQQQAVPVQPPRQPGLCRGRAEVRPAAPLWGHPTGGTLFVVFQFLFLKNNLFTKSSLRPHSSEGLLSEKVVSPQ